MREIPFGFKKPRIYGEKLFLSYELVSTNHYTCAKIVLVNKDIKELENIDLDKNLSDNAVTIVKGVSSLFP